MHDSEFKKSLNAASLEFKEEPMDNNYRNPLVGVVSRGRLTRLIKEMGQIKYKKILDIGCEAGYFSIMMQKSGANVFSFDICMEALEEFKNKGFRESKIFRAAAQRMPIADNVFDYVVCTEVIEHMPRLDLAFSEMNRVLKKSGKLFITFPNEALRKALYPIAKLAGVNTSVEDEVTLFEYKFSEILRLVSMHFRIIKKYSWPSYFPLTRFIVAQKVN